MSIHFKENSFMNPAFHWFTGVIEDIDDPMEMGRVRVRCYGYHTANTTSENGIPTSALPWAHVMMPVTSASCSGIGQSATGILPGSWVVGFFRDGKACQDPFVMGTIPSRTPALTNADDGFGDPAGNNPRNPNETDIPRGSRTEYKSSKSYIKKNDLRNQTKEFKDSQDNSPSGVKTALPPNTATLIRTKGKDGKAEGPFYERKEWLQPDHTETTQPQYPFCHTTEYGRGHIVEYDETPTKERLLSQHSAGTFQEITHDGSRTTVVVGEEYSVYFKDNNINVKGNCNLTINGDCRTLVRGDYYMEVEKDYHLNVHGSVHKKVGLGEFIEIKKDRVENIELSLDTTIGKSEKRLIKGAAHNNSPAESYVLEVVKGGDISFGENLNTVISGNQDMTTLGTLNNTSGARTDVINGAFKIDGTGILDVDAGGNISLDTVGSGSIDFPTGNITVHGIGLHTHTHTDPGHANHGSQTSAGNDN